MMSALKKKEKSVTLQWSHWQSIKQKRKKRGRKTQNKNNVNPSVTVKSVSADCRPQSGYREDFCKVINLDSQGHCEGNSVHFKRMCVCLLTKVNICV